MNEKSENKNKKILFDSFGLDKLLLSNINSIGYETPTAIQEKAIPFILNGRDVLGAAQTGTGKTAAFVLPIINKILPYANSSASPARHLLRVLILVPTRELANQVYDSVVIYSKNTNLRSVVLFGGADYNSQENNLKLGCEILVATPGRLIAHIEQGNLHLQNIEIFVLDEADRMLDMGFMPDIDKIISKLPKNRQTLFFSATFSKFMRKIGMSYLKDPVELDITSQNSIADNVEQLSYIVPDRFKMDAVVSILKSRVLETIIIFTNTKLSTIKLTSFLRSNDIQCDSIHGDKSQLERTAVLERFKNGILRILVATDVAARGLDVIGISCVINFDIPHSPEDYVHRIGRTGRANNTGIAISLISNDEEDALLSSIERFTDSTILRLPLNYMKLVANDNKILGSNDELRNKQSVLLGSNNIITSYNKDHSNKIKTNNIRITKENYAILLGGTGKK
ncbi:MAG: DEAD/DEAH box helicase [Candidatus Kinetoplastibacterium crithidii]|nr:MAG: DEAD/DEAH box helicase [Candidatus Kinetoplastibacterium crithidii]